jgi:predicted nucleic acid-binding protein
VIVVSDTSAISALLHIGRIEILQVLFGTVIIPPEVRKELLRTHQDLPELLNVREPVEHAAVEDLLKQVDAGEAEAIVLAKEIEADFLLIDEKLGRAVAVRQGVRVVGLLGVLGAAKQRGLIASLRETIEELQREAKFRVSEAVKEAVYRQFDET